MLVSHWQQGSTLSVLRGYLLCFDLCPLPLVLLLDITEKGRALSYLHHLFEHLRTFVNSALRLLFSKMKSPISEFSHRGNCPASSSSFQLFTELSPTYQDFFCTGEPRTGHSTPDVASSVLSRGQVLPVSMCGQCFASCKLGDSCMAKAHYWLMINSVFIKTPGIFLPRCFPAVCLLTYVVAWVAPPWRRDFALPLLK